MIELYIAWISLIVCYSFPGRGGIHPPSWATVFVKIAQATED